MKSALKLAAVAMFCLAFAGQSFASPSHATILPKNNLDRLDNKGRIANIDEKTFNSIIDTIINAFQPVAASHGAHLSADKLWDDSTVNASAEQDGNEWKVTMYGGLARRPEVTPDAFVLVVCHELGHHFGGYYFYDDGDWAAAEGEADYFATQVCGRAMFQKMFRRNHIYREGVPSVVQQKCDASWKTPEQQDLCYRLSAGGLALANLLASAGGEKPPHFETPDKSKVSHTNVDHPEAQCRLDTYFQGALCLANFDLRVIPGKTENGGNNSVDAEKEAAKVTCIGQPQGDRPACWFKSQTTFR
jgi:hypothetical protein